MVKTKIQSQRSIILNQEWNGTEVLESKLVQIKNIRFVDKGRFSSFRNYQITDGVNNISLRINRAGKLENTDIPTDPISIIGIVSQYTSSPPYNHGYQLLMRFPDDIIIK